MTDRTRHNPPPRGSAPPPPPPLPPRAAPSIDVEALERAIESVAKRRGLYAAGARYIAAEYARLTKPAQPAAPETERLRDDRRWMEHTNDCSRSREGVYSKGCTCGAEVVGRLPIYCTGDCDACRDYARELGVPLVVPAAPETERLREALDAAAWVAYLGASAGVGDPTDQALDRLRDTLDEAGVDWRSARAAQPAAPETERHHSPVQYDAGCNEHDGTTERHCALDGHPMPAAPEPHWTDAYGGIDPSGGRSLQHRAQPAAPETCPTCGWITSHDHCTECQARNAMPWTHVETCSRYRPATDFDTDDARAFLERAAAQPAAPETERLREALETLRSAMRTDPADRFWEGWDAALMAVEVAVFPDPLRAAIPAQPAAPETLTWQVVEAAMHDVGEENGCDPACPQLYPSDAPALRRAILARLMKPAPRREPEYHEHVAGDKHSHAFNGPHSHGGVSALAQPAAPETERHEEAGGGS